ncbi:MAG: hypothetical protein OXN83_04355 [Oligoflexia bacterium]|nr:hypothetical protein [Oligoflexia bacterium]
MRVLLLSCLLLSGCSHLTEENKKAEIYHYIDHDYRVVKSKNKRDYFYNILTYNNVMKRVLTDHEIALIKNKPFPAIKKLEDCLKVVQEDIEHIKKQKIWHFLFRDMLLNDYNNLLSVRRNIVFDLSLIIEKLKVSIKKSIEKRKRMEKERKILKRIKTYSI